MVSFNDAKHMRLYSIYKAWIKYGVKDIEVPFKLIDKLEKDKYTQEETKELILNFIIGRKIIYDQVRDGIKPTTQQEADKWAQEETNRFLAVAFEGTDEANEILGR